MVGVPSIDVLVATTTRDLVLSCLAHLRPQTVPHEIYLIDNAGNENGTSDAVRAEFPEVHLVTSDQNLGFGNAMNRLAAIGTGEAIVLVNDDMDVEPQFLAELVAPFEDSDVGMVAGLTMQPGDDQVVDGFGIEVDCTLLAFNRLRHRRPTAVPGRLAGPSGGAAAYRRTAWARAGGFDPRLFLYAEDLDLALRLRLDGWRAVAAAGARGIHYGGATSGRDSPAQRHHAGFGRGFMLRRYGVLRGRNAPRALLIEALTVVYGAVRGRTLIPLVARLAGWRAAGPEPSLPIPEGAVDPSISVSEALRRLRCER